MMDMNDGYETEARSTISSSSRAERRRNLMEKEKWDLEADAISNGRSDDAYHGKLAQNFEYMDISDKRQEESRMRRSVEMMDGRNVDIISQEMDGFRSAQRMDYEGVRYTTDSDPPIAYATDSYEMEGLPGYMMNKGKEKAPYDRRMAHQEPYISENLNAYASQSQGMNRASLNPESQFRRSAYQNQYMDPSPLNRSRETSNNGYYPQQDPRVQVQGYGDHPVRSQMPMRRNNPYENHSAPYPRQPSQGYMPGRYMNHEMVYRDTMDPYNYPQASRHHPSCSCSQCFNKREVPGLVQSSLYGEKLSGHVSDDTRFNYRDNQGSFEYSHNPQLHSRWPSDVNSEVGGFAPQQPQRARLSSSGQVCHPMAGGAPFLTCCNCSELLLLPNKVLTQRSHRKKMRCGSCSTLIVFMISQNSLVVLIDDVHAVTMANGDRGLDQERPSLPYSDSAGYNIQSTDREEDHTRDYRSPNMRRNDPPSTYTFEAVDDVVNNNENVHVDDKQQPDKPVSSAQFSTPDTTSATVIEIPSNEYGTGMSLDSGDGSRGFRPKMSFPGVYDDTYYKNARANQASDESEMANVTVNGHLIPNRAIMKAERLAGPIKPGHYWYDFRAGFWGLMGGHCCGIIPPFIVEFNYPMPENCSSGNTGVLVNGRELDEKDLNLLGQRGLPRNRDRSYIVELSGRVLDAFNGEELPNLGKLAPSMEKAKKGFGMSDPRMNV